MPVPVFERIVLKLSGEALMGSQEFGIDEPVVAQIAGEIKEVWQLGVETAIVIELPLREGFALLRVFVADETKFEAAAEAVQSASCSGAL